jgi:hypothetical protein
MVSAKNKVSCLWMVIIPSVIFCKMHDAITPPITNLEANSKTGVSFEFGWSYRLIKWQGK